MPVVTTISTSDNGFDRLAPHEEGPMKPYEPDDEAVLARLFRIRF